MGHLKSGQGVEPVPDKLESVRNMPSPTNSKKVKQYLGLVEYYMKFILHLADVAMTVTTLTRKNVLFDWTTKCQEAFDLLRQSLM